LQILKNYSVEYIVETIENFTGKKANCQIILKESIPSIDTGLLQPFFSAPEYKV